MLNFWEHFAEILSSSWVKFGKTVIKFFLWMRWPENLKNFWENVDWIFKKVCRKYWEYFKEILCKICENFKKHLLTIFYIYIRKLLDLVTNEDWRPFCAPRLPSFRRFRISIFSEVRQSLKRILATFLFAVNNIRFQ